ncbi:hypothetical protein KSD_84740 [Ktedonobacter sp. SOSP1-85]|uniref:hypothetical protein n=1 Tax=Ktedonobacter sp. SOSP1-85 TaxID=2778367 RepID=UPI001914DC96|nr:hypothetical protein [Ktedonobacter sp. SOSP1-85]GHO80703.1 hypothetical protein KSD_84740 [Ktedonobacter sp. SOSP1-85]
MTVEKGLAQDSPSSSAKQSSQGRRAATIAVALPIVLLFVWLGGWFLFALLTFVLCMMTMELRSLMIQASHRPVLWFSFALALFLLASAMFPQQRLMLLSDMDGPRTAALVPPVLHACTRATPTERLGADARPGTLSGMAT